MACNCTSLGLSGADHAGHGEFFLLKSVATAKASHAESPSSCVPSTPGYACSRAVDETAEAPGSHSSEFASLTLRM